jgi:hypothetical protein
MASRGISTEDKDWLERSGLLDLAVDLERVRLHVGPPWSWYLRFAGNSAITFGNHVWYRDEERRKRRDLLVHELVHVAQYAERGFFHFLWRYLLDLAKARFRYSRELPLEQPAYARQKIARQMRRDDDHRA